MKKVIIFTLVPITLSISACLLYFNYTAFVTRNWQKIFIQDCGSFKIPSEWIYYEEDNYIYITDHDSNPIMIQSYSNPISATNFNPAKLGRVESNKFFDKIQNIKSIFGTNISNGAYYGKMLTLKDKQEQENFWLEIGYKKIVLFIIWDKKIDLKLLKIIADTYNYEGFFP